MSAQPVFQSTRRFQVWLYTVSHAQLLLRANPRFEGDERIEVLFKAVHWMSIPTVLHGLTIQELDPDSARALLANFGDAPFHDGERQGTTHVLVTGDRVFSVRGDGYEGVVVALAAYVHRDNLSDCAPSGFYEDNLFAGVHRRP